MFKWEQGRQNTNYWKLKIISWWFFDLYLLMYPEGSFIPPHQDPVEGKKHYRLNIELMKAKEGGEFICRGGYQWGRFILFRPDLYEHAVTRITKGKRYLLSLGWVLNN